MANVGAVGAARVRSAGSSAGDKILQIERKYTGPANANKTAVTHEDAQAAIDALGKNATFDVGARGQLADFLNMFGGNEVHPKSMFTPKDRQAMLSAVMKGVESGDKLTALPKPLQAQVLSKLAFDGINDALGIKTKHDIGPNYLEGLNPAARKNVEAAIKDLKVPSGYGLMQGHVYSASRGGKPYGYSFELVYGGPGAKTFEANLLVNAKGTVLRSSGGVIRPDNTPED
jgi:hypothetical protein